MTLIRRIFEGLLTAYILSLYLAMGNDLPGHLTVRLIGGAALLAVFIPLIFMGLRPKISASFILLAAFLVYEVIRAAWAWQTGGGQPEFKTLYLKAPLYWGLYVAVFSMAAAVYRDRASVSRLLKALIWISFLIAVSILPAILIYGAPSYPSADGKNSLFFPFLYSHPWVPRYVLSRFGHPNYSGDLLAAGFFAALSLAWYIGDLFLETRRRYAAKLAAGKVHEREKPPLPVSGLLYLFLGLVTGAAILLLFSRGTISCWLVGTGVCLGLILLKWPSRRMFITAFVVVVLGIGFLGWAVNLPRVWSELQTIRQEQDAGRDIAQSGEAGASRSIYTNMEGLSRAWRISRDYPLWGVGTQGYGLVAKKYIREGWERHHLADYTAMNHYAQMLAEEGAGCLLYFLFLAVYGWEILQLLFRKVKSRFQGLACIAMIAWLAMIFAHASINFFLENIMFSILLHALMGALAGMARGDFLQRNTA